MCLRYPPPFGFTTGMADDWRLTVAPQGDTDPPSVLEYVLEHELEEEASKRLGHRVAVEVSAGDSAVFFYADQEEPIREAEGLVRAILERQGVEAKIDVARWHPLEERWEDASVPLPQSEAEQQAETGRLEAEEVAES